MNSLTLMVSTKYFKIIFKDSLFSQRPEESNSEKDGVDSTGHLLRYHGRYLGG